MVFFSSLKIKEKFKYDGIIYIKVSATQGKQIDRKVWKDFGPNVLVLPL